MQYYWTTSYGLSFSGTAGALLSTTFSETTSYLYKCSDGTWQNSCMDTCDNGFKTGYDIMKFIKQVTSQPFTRTYVPRQATGYCQLSFFIEQSNADAFSSDAVVSTTTPPRTNITGLISYFDPGASGQIQEDGSYTGTTGGSSVTSTGIFGSTAASVQPIASVLVALVAAVAAFLRL